jgi:hypothetical protein
MNLTPTPATRVSAHREDVVTQFEGPTYPTQPPVYVRPMSAGNSIVAGAGAGIGACCLAPVLVVVALVIGFMVLAAIGSAGH